MDHMEGGRPPLSPAVTAASRGTYPWIHELPYNALSEEESYGSFGLYASSALSHHTTGKDRFYRGGSNHLLQGTPGVSAPKGLTRSISSSEAIRRQRMPLSELLSTSQAPHASFLSPNQYRRSPLSSATAGSCEFDVSNEAWSFENGRKLSPTKNRYPSTSFPMESPFTNTGSRSSYFGARRLLQRARSDRYELDRIMSRRSLDHAELHTVDASRSPLHKSLYDVHVADVGAYEQTDVGHEMGNVDHSYDQLGYSRERSEMKSMDKNAARPLHGPMPKGSAYNATGRVPSASTGFNTSYNAGGRKRVTMKDMLAVDIDLSIESPSHPAFQPNRTAAMAPKPPLCNHRKSVDSAIGLRYHRNGADEVFYSANNVPPYMHSPTEHVRPVHLYSEIPSHATNARDLPYISRPVNDMSVSDRQYANRTAYKNVNADQRTTLVGRDEDGDSSTSGRKDSRENARMDLPESKPMARLTKGRSTVDNVTENILRKMLLLCEKGNDQSWDGEDFTSAKILFKRVLLVQIQAMGYILADICANDGMLAAAHLWADQMSRSSHLKTRSKGNDVIHGDHSLLALQKVAYETGMSTFDVLLSMRHTLLDRLQMPIFGGIQQTQSTMRMACVGGFPGCAAIAIRLFFMMTSPALDLQVEDWGRPQDGSRHIVEEIRLRGVEWVGVDEGENAMDLLRKNVSKIKYYRLLLIMLDCTAQRDTRSLKFPAIGRKKYNEADDTWRKMWDEVAESALPGTVMVVYQRAASGRTSWEDIAPSVGPWHFQAPTHLQHCVRIGRK